MEYRRIGQSDIHVSAISLGTWALGGPSFSEDGRPSGWSAVNEQVADGAIKYAVDRGVTHFDTADVYGNGLSENLLGRSLQSINRTVTFASKIGYQRNAFKHAYHPDNIRLQCEATLRNLKRECIDIYYFHHGDFGTNDCYLNDALNAMHSLKVSGKIREIGLSAYAFRDFARLVPDIKPAVVQVKAHCLDDHFIRAGSPMEKLCITHGCTMVAFSPLAQGVLTGKYSSTPLPVFGSGDHRAGNPLFKAEKLARAEDGIAQVKQLFGNSKESLVRSALGYVLYQKKVSCVIPGFRNIEQVKELLSVENVKFTKDDVAGVRRCFIPASSAPC